MNSFIPWIPSNIGRWLNQHALVQVLVPPSTKALKWCSQFRRSSLFPQFYLSRKLTSGPSSQLEICGIGSAICLHGSYAVKNGFDLVLRWGSTPSPSPFLWLMHTLIPNKIRTYFPCRYISSDSHLIRAYGFVGMKYDKESSSIEEKPGSYYFFIPLVKTMYCDQPLCNVNSI